MKNLIFLMLFCLVFISCNDRLSASGVNVNCDRYPISVDFDNSETQARQDLVRISSNAQMQWNEERGTPSYIINLQKEISCASGENARKKIWRFIDAHPTVFRQNSQEWNEQLHYDCDIIDATSKLIANTRQKYGEHKLNKGVFNFKVKRINHDKIILDSIIMNAIPESKPELNEKLTQCATNTNLLYKNIRSHQFPYLIYGGSQLCVPIAQDKYTIASDDTINIVDTYWSWQNNSQGGITFKKQGNAYLRVSQTNYTNELLKSNAFCSMEDVGFRILFDAVTGEILNKIPGISCQVC